MNTTNIRKLSAAMGLVLSLAALSSQAADTARVGHIVDLPAVTVQLDNAQRAEFGIARTVTLPAVTVRPDPALRTELAIRAVAARVVDLPAVYVQPPAELMAERAAIVAAEQARTLAAHLASTLVVEAGHATAAR